jgi:hypothetical protein
MYWNFMCPKCNEWHQVKWTNRLKIYKCQETKIRYIPPSPSLQYEAYVDTYEWTDEMKRATIALKGIYCSVEGCRNRYGTLYHKVPWTKGGRTSVNNLFPICHAHSRSIDDTDT